jgi:radical SAM/Cys-rich protein
MTDLEKGSAVEPFREALQRHNLRLCREVTTSLQVNVGLNCGLSCRHCHLEAGPARGEMMPRTTMEGVIDSARRFRFASIDITGGSPELVPGIDYLVRELAALTPKLIVRSNLVALGEGKGPELSVLYRELGVLLIASLPATNAAQTEAQRGEGVWGKSIAALKMLNALGYGVGGALQLHLVANPSGAFLPPPQPQAQKKFREDLRRRHGVSFNDLYIFANSPLGRFKTFLERSGNLEDYLGRLAAGFNPCALQGVMCRTQLSVDWEGRLYDCDFNLAVGLRHQGEADSIFSLTELPPPGSPIPVGNHCYACTVGSGFT